jgi:hypothetical protein
MGKKARVLRRHHTARLNAKRSYYSNARYYGGQKGGMIAIDMSFEFESGHLGGLFVCPLSSRGSIVQVVV